MHIGTNETNKAKQIAPMLLYGWMIDCLISHAKKNYVRTHMKSYATVSWKMDQNHRTRRKTKTHVFTSRQHPVESLSSMSVRTGLTLLDYAACTDILLSTVK